MAPDSSRPGENSSVEESDDKNSYWDDDTRDEIKPGSPYVIDLTGSPSPRGSSGHSSPSISSSRERSMERELELEEEMQREVEEYEMEQAAQEYEWYLQHCRERSEAADVALLMATAISPPPNQRRRHRANSDAEVMGNVESTEMEMERPSTSRSVSEPPSTMLTTESKKRKVRDDDDEEEDGDVVTRPTKRLRVRSSRRHPYDESRTSITNVMMKADEFLAASLTKKAKSTKNGPKVLLTSPTTKQWIASQLALGHRKNKIIASLNATTMDTRLAEMVLIYHQHQQPRFLWGKWSPGDHYDDEEGNLRLPKSFPGLWTGEDNAAVLTRKYLQSGRDTTKTWERLVKKHGQARVQARIEFLEALVSV